MPKKKTKGRGNRGGGRKSLSSRESPLLEDRLKIVADLYADRKTIAQIAKYFRDKYEKEIEAAGGDESKASQLYKLAPGTVQIYINEIRRRWREEDADETIQDKRKRLIRGYERAYQLAANKAKFIKELHQPDVKGSGWFPAPETFAMIQALTEIAKIEGLYIGNEPKDNDLDSIIDEIATRRNEKQAKGDIKTGD